MVLIRACRGTFMKIDETLFQADERTKNIVRKPDNSLIARTGLKQALLDIAADAKPTESKSLKRLTAWLASKDRLCKSDADREVIHEAVLIGMFAAGLSKDQHDLQAYRKKVRPATEVTKARGQATIDKVKENVSAFRYCGSQHMAAEKIGDRIGRSSVTVVRILAKLYPGRVWHK
jgi:hypothetical protein